jgi:hypothetical protein
MRIPIIDILRMSGNFSNFSTFIIQLPKGAAMKNTLSQIIMTISMVMISFSIAVGQSLVWESTTMVPAMGDKKIISTSYYRPQMFRQGSENSIIIFRIDKEVMYQVNNLKKEYSEMTFAELQAYTKNSSAKLDGQMAEMKKQLEKMPPEQRKAMEKMMENQGMAGTSNGKIEVVKTAEKKDISGYACVKYVLQEDGKETGSVWTTTGIPDFKSMQKDFKDFGQRMAAQMPTKGGQMAAAMAKIDGFPIQTTIAGITTTVTKIEKKPVAVTEFEVPAGYKKVDQKSLMNK